MTKREVEQPKTSVTVTFEVENEEIESLLISAIESGGIRYWGHVDSTSCPDRAHYWGVTIYENEDPRRECVMNHASIVRGLQVMAREYPDHFKDVLISNCDMVTADVFIQCALFGEIVYG